MVIEDDDEPAKEPKRRVNMDAMVGDFLIEKKKKKQRKKRGGERDL